MGANRFQHGSGCYECRVCKKKTRATGDSNQYISLCAGCYEEAGLRNEHTDGYHETVHPQCPVCNGGAR